MADFTLPELGENIAAGDVLRLLVKPGDAITKDQPILELETDKATIEVPSSVAGTVKEIKVKAGEKVKVGATILTYDAAAGGAAEVSPKQAVKPEPAKADAPVEKDDATEEGQPDVEVKDQSIKPDKSGVKDPTVGPQAVADAESSRRPAPQDRTNVVDISRGARPAAEAATSDAPPAPAAPSVRRTARELGVEINDVKGSGANGRISIEDVKEHVKRLVTSGAGRGAAASAPLPDFSRWGAIAPPPMRAVRRKTAEHLSVAWQTIPHVTQCDLADI